MNLSQFDHGYWYATELKQFAETLGIPSPARLRKDELEHAIKQFLRSGRIIRSSSRRRSRSEAERDVDGGLHLDRRVIRYTNDVATREFLDREASRLAPGLRRRSGARHRLNRWRENQLANGVELTYRQVVEEYVRLSQSTEPFARVPHGRYLNFLSEFLSRRIRRDKRRGDRGMARPENDGLPQDVSRLAQGSIEKVAVMSSGSADSGYMRPPTPPAIHGRGFRPKKPAAKSPVHTFVIASEIKWGEPPPVFAKGMSFTAISGDPGKPGLYVVRAKMPAGYKIQPHWHPTDEHVTVLSGTLALGMGQKFDEASMTKLPAGGYALLPADMRHFAMATTATTIQVHGQGPES
ncbi:MAG: hypothetical protein ABIQ52_19020 [Vicinamibacterales bacterium]